MLGFYRCKQTLLFSVFSFIAGCMLTCFFMKIDDSTSRRLPKYVTKPRLKPTSLPLGLQETDHKPSPSIGLELDVGLGVGVGPDLPIVLVILIVTSPANIGKRNSLRETWLQFCKDNTEVRYYFVIGSAKLDEDQEASIFSEQEANNDLLLLPTIIDNYTLLAKKVLTAFVWVDKSVKSYQYVLKCDDDSFVRVNELVAELKSSFSNDQGVSLYWGFFSGKSRVKKLGKWREASWNLCDHYLPYALGGGYVLSQQLINLISRNSQNLLCFKSEDVSVGAWLAPFSVNREHDCRFDTEFKSRGCSNQYLITHKRTEEEMHTLYSSLKTTGKLCQAEYRSRPSYIYNWGVPPSECCAQVMDDPNIP